MTTKDYQPTTRIVAFLDVLGFKELTRASLHDPELLKQIDSSFRTAQDMLGPYQGFKIETQMFSDSICCSTEFEPDKTWKFLYTIEALQMNLVCMGLYLRGGMAIGSHFENERMIVSQALIDAYGLENQRARYPRIILSANTFGRVAKSLMDAYELDDWDSGFSSITKDPDSHVRKDSDGEYFLSYLMSLRRIDRSAIIDEYVSQHKDSVSNWLNEGRAKDLPVKQREKHEWLQRYHNLMIAELFPNGDIEDYLVR